MFGRKVSDSGNDTYALIAEKDQEIARLNKLLEDSKTELEEVGDREYRGSARESGRDLGT